MATGQGTATLNFGTSGSNEASVLVSDTNIYATSKAEAYVMGDDTTTDHTANDHRYFNLFATLTCGTPAQQSGFTIYANSTQKLTGTFQVRYVWAD